MSEDMSTQWIGEILKGSPTAVGAGFLGILYFAYRIYLMIKSDTRSERQADQLANANQTMIDNLQKEVTRLASIVQVCQDDIGKLREDKLNLQSELLIIKSQNTQLIQENQHLRSMLNMPLRTAPPGAVPGTS